MESRPRYNKTAAFDPFPFPACVTDDLDIIHRERLYELGERLDGHRKRVMERHDHLTMTGMYNVLERVRELNGGIGEPLSASEKDVYDAALIGVLAEIHDEIDQVVLDAYGWDDLADALVGKVGGTLPSPHKSPDQEAAEEELLVRLVALNKERREEERRGHVRWLRPDYQIPRLGHKVTTETDDLELEVAAVKDAPAWPKDGLAQIKSVRDILALADAPLAPDIVSAAFKARNTAKRRARVAEVLGVLEDMGQVRSLEESDKFFAVF